METLAQYLANGTSYTVAKNHTPNVGSSPLSCYSLMVFELKRTSLGFFEIRLTFFFFKCTNVRSSCLILQRESRGPRKLSDQLTSPEFRLVRVFSVGGAGEEVRWEGCQGQGQCMLQRPGGSNQNEDTIKMTPQS